MFVVGVIIHLWAEQEKNGSECIDENPCNVVDGDIVRVSIPAGACELD